MLKLVKQSLGWRVVWLSWAFLSWVLLPFMSWRVTHVWWCQAKPHFLSLSAWWPLGQIPWLGLIRETPQGSLVLLGSRVAWPTPSCTSTAPARRTGSSH